MKLSIIIPTLNEAETIRQSLLSLQYFRKLGHEIILADGGSQDTTCFIAHPLVDHILISEPGRGRQMNLGAKIATGKILIFLHADTLLPQDAEMELSRLSGQQFWGRFDIKLSGTKKIYRLIEKMINIRSRISGIATGDQAIFMTRELYEKVNGFPDIPLMEDVAVSKKLKKIAPPVCLGANVVTSSRRWESRGVINTVLLMWILRMQYTMGVTPEKLANRYE